MAEFSGAFSLWTEGSSVRVLSPGCSLTAVVSLAPPTVQRLAEHVSEWLLAHHGPGVLFDCRLAAGDACLFVFLPSHVGDNFAGAVQFVRGQPFLRLVSRGALHHTPAERLRFLTFETDSADTLAVTQTADASSSSQGPGEADGGHPPDAEDGVNDGHSLLQVAASVRRMTMQHASAQSGKTDLLEALPARAAESQPEKPTLAISDCLPGSSEVRSLSALLRALVVWGGTLWSPFASLRVPRNIQRLLPPCNMPFHSQAPTALHVFTDGSADHSFAGWGAVLVAEYGGPDKRGIVAVAGCRVTESPAPPSFSARTNNAAEAWTLLAAQLAALALPAYLPLTFWIDSRVTLEGATGQASPASIQGDPALSNAVRASAHAAATPSTHAVALGARTRQSWLQRTCRLRCRESRSGSRLVLHLLDCALSCQATT